VYTFWDVDNWCKDRKEMTVMYADLEEKNQPVFAPLPTIMTVTQHQAALAQQPGLQPQQVQAGPRGAFQM
jgi:CCR4-NOT transcription complex subunit 2